MLLMIIRTSRSGDMGFQIPYRHSSFFKTPPQNHGVPPPKAEHFWCSRLFLCTFQHSWRALFQDLAHPQRPRSGKPRRVRRFSLHAKCKRPLGTDKGVHWANFIRVSVPLTCWLSMHKAVWEKTERRNRQSPSRRPFFLAPFCADAINVWQGILSDVQKILPGNSSDFAFLCNSCSHICKSHQKILHT